MKKFIIFTYTILFYSLTSFYGFSSDLLKPHCSTLFNNKGKSFDGMIQTLMNYSGEQRTAPWIQRTIQLMEEKSRVKYPDSTEMQAILRLLEEKIGDKNQLLEVLRLSPRILHGLRENSLETHLKPLFETLEGVFGQDTVSNALKHSLRAIELKPNRVKQITALLKGDTPILIVENQRTFTIHLDFMDRDINNLLIKYPNAYRIPLENLIGSNSLESIEAGNYRKGLIQVLWPFIKSFTKAKLTIKASEENSPLPPKSEINRQTTEAIKTLFFQSPFTFYSKKPEPLVDLFKALTGEEKLLINLNQEIIELNFGFENYVIGRLILENRDEFLRNNKEKLKSNIEILWPFIKALTVEHLKPTRGNVITPNELRNETILAIKKLFIESPTGFTMQPTSLDSLIKILTGETEISFPHDNQIITLRIKLKDSNIGELFQRNPSGFSMYAQGRLESTIKTLWPFINAFAQENLKSQQRSSEISQENLKNETVRIIEETILQSLQGFSTNIEFLNPLIKILIGEREISFPYDNQTLNLRLNFEDHQIGQLFLKNPIGFSRMNQNKLKLIIKSLWPFIKAFTQEDLTSQQQRSSDISQEQLKSETVRNIEKAMLRSPQGFATSIESKSLNNLIKILKGEEEISFSHDNQTITVRFNFENHEIGDLFLKNSKTFLLMSQGRLESTIKTLWPFIKAFTQEDLTSQQQRSSDISQEQLKSETVRNIEEAMLRSPKGFSTTIESESLNNLIKILKGENEISFSHDNQTITVRFNFENHEIGDLFLKSPDGFLRMSQNKLEFTIKTLWPFIKAFTQESLTSQQQIDSRISQEQLKSETIRNIEKAIFRAPRGFSTNIESETLNNLIKTLKGENEISFPYDNQTLNLRLNFEAHQIGDLFLKNPKTFSLMSQQKLKSTIKTLWPFIKAFTQENLTSQQQINSRISLEQLKNETVRNIEKAIFRAPGGFSTSIESESLNNLIKILKGEKEVSFSNDRQTITLRFNFKNHEIGEFFLNNPFGFSQIGKNLEQVLQMLWPSLKEDFIFEEGTTIVKSNESMKELIQEVLAIKTVPNLN